MVLPADVADDNVVHRVSPVYPREAKEKKVHGPVLLQAMVDKDGNVDFVKVVDGNALLITAAVDVSDSGATSLTSATARQLAS